MKALLIRADDIGYSEGVSNGIRSSYTYGIVKNAGIMVNMPYSKQAMTLVRNDDICFGLHVNLVVGKPCCKDTKQVERLLNEKGEFISSAIRRQQIANQEHPFVYQDVYQEVEAQMQVFIQEMGRLPEYIDLHGIEDAILKQVVCDIGSVYGILDCPYYHDSLITMPTSSLQYEFYKTKKPYVAFFKEKYLMWKEHAITMLIMHPGFIDAALMASSSLVEDRIYDHALLCDTNVKTWLQKEQIQLVSYRDYRRYLETL